MGYKKIGHLLMALILFISLLETACPHTQPTEGDALKSVMQDEQVPKTAKELIGVDNGEGTTCTPLMSKDAPTQAGCRAGLLCVPEVWDPEKGRCLIECGRGENGRLAKVREKCPKERTCVQRRDAELKTIGMFCLKPQKERDMSCEAPYDKEACNGQYNCLPTSAKTTPEKKTILSAYLCKAECLADRSCENAEEICVEAPFSRKEKQSNPQEPSKQQHCSVSLCQKNDPSCPCDGKNDYRCVELLKGLGTDVGICQRSVGICATKVRWARSEDLARGTYVGPTCNEKTDHRFCDPMGQGFSGTSYFPSCVPLGGTGEGACLSYCRLPALDHDQDGVLKGDELGMSMNCPPQYDCQTSVARALGQHSLLQTNGQEKMCDPKKCVPNQPCPGECGMGDAECLKVGKKNAERFVCGAPFGTCEPVRPNG